MGEGRSVRPLDPRLPGILGLAAGLAAAPLIASPGQAAVSLALVAGVLVPWVLAVRSRPSQRVASRIACVAVAAAVCGLVVGEARVRAVDAGALRGEPGRAVSLEGYVAAPPRRSRGTVRVLLDTPRGRVEAHVPEPIEPLRMGRQVSIRGRLEAPPPWLRAHLRRQGVVRLVRAGGLRLTGHRRGGLAGRLDGVRDRAESAMGRGVPTQVAELVRGMVLGQDAGIDARTREEWKRAGLAHFLAVSGTNVMFLCLLAGALLAALGIPHRARLVALIALIAVYVPLTGAGPSIQRAGIMGAAGVLATLAGRPKARWHAVALAAAGTLLLDPRAGGDVGWQLSFSAVIGILLWVPGLVAAGTRVLGDGAWQRALAQGAAITVAATVATAPLMAHHFGAFPVASLPANVLALPAIAPVMWLGMLVAAAGQVPALPVEPLSVPGGALAAYVREVGRALAAPSWAYPAVTLGPGGLLASWAAILVAAYVGGRAMRRRLELGVRAGRRVAALALVLLLAFPVGARVLAPAPPGAPPAGAVLAVDVLDIGQGDAILLRPLDADPLLVDGGPPGAGLVAELRRRGVERLSAALVTHPDSDHAGGIIEALAEIPTDRLLVGLSSPEIDAAAAAAGLRPEPIADGDEVRAGSLLLEVLWPPRAPPVPGTDPNDLSLVLLARTGSFTMLLTGDAEAEAVPIDPGEVDVLKVAHHGSRDEGLPALLVRAMPELAVISAGRDNQFGHPAPETLAALRAAGVPVRRTDRDGHVRIEVAAGGRWRLP